MRHFDLARVLGFQIRIDFSWFILFFLILWSLTVAVFPNSAPGLPGFAYPLMGLAGTLIFFVSLLAHELSHAVVARAKGIPVDGITLFLFGGMAHTRTEAATPGDEFQIAVVGPLMSLALAAGLGSLWWLGAQLDWGAAVLAVTQYLAVLNGMLAIFNLLPGFPLDGGRLLRSVVWKVTGDVNRATRVASTGGRWLAYALIGWGLWLAFGGSVVGGMWLVLIGWFLRNAAISSYEQHVVLSRFTGVDARQVMTGQPPTVAADLPLDRLLNEYFLHYNLGAFPVVAGDGGAVGIVTRQQVEAVSPGDRARRTTREVMTPASVRVVVAPDEPLLTVMDRMKATPVQHVLVLRGGEVLGIISPTDIAAWLGRAQWRDAGRG